MIFGVCYRRSMSKTDSDQLLDKITKGVQLAVKRLLDRTKKEDGELVFSKNGKIVYIKARDIQ
jgi:hypothetical protein